MSDRPTHRPVLEFSHRPEYDLKHAEAYYAPAAEALENLVEYHPGIVQRTFESGASKREITISSFDDDEHADEILFSDFTRLGLQRYPIYTEIHVEIEERHRALVRQMAKFVIHQYIADSAPFINEYYLEVYAGGGRQALVSSTDVIQGQGLETRVMTRYDTVRLLRHVEQSAAILAALQSRTAAETGWHYE